MSQGEWCCPMRQKYLMGIVGEVTELPTPSEVVDFLDFDKTTTGGAPLLRTRFCPWCGKAMGPDAPRHETDFTQEGR